MRTGVMNRATLSQQVYAEIKSLIMTEQLAPGERLNETELAARLGISPTPLREAINRLRGDGLVVHSAWQGATVVALTSQDVRHLYDIRAQLECLSVREAAERLSSQDLKEMDDLVARARSAIAASDVSLLHELNEQFHQMFLTRSENPWLQKMLGELSDLLILARRPLTVERSGRETWLEHSQILAALHTGDSVAAEAVMAAHIDRVKQELLAQLEIESLK